MRAAEPIIFCGEGAREASQTQAAAPRNQQQGAISRQASTTRRMVTPWALPLRPWRTITVPRLRHTASHVGSQWLPCRIPVASASVLSGFHARAQCFPHRFSVDSAMWRKTFHVPFAAGAAELGGDDRVRAKSHHGIRCTKRPPDTFANVPPIVQLTAKSSNCMASFCVFTVSGRKSKLKTRASVILCLFSICPPP